MSWRLEWSKPAEKDMRRLSTADANRVRAALVRLAETNQGDVTRLIDVDPPEWRLRAGDIRVRFTYQAVDRTILVLRVLPRGGAY